MFLNFVYLLLLVALLPILAYRSVRQGKYQAGWSQKFLGRLNRNHPDKPCLWFHAVSVGEVLQLRGLLTQVAARWPTHELLLTTTTRTGYSVAQEQYAGAAFGPICVQYFPLDFTWSVANAISRIQPAAIFLVELEVWPNLVRTATRQGIPIAILNGRLSEKSFRGYRWLKPWITPALCQMRAIAVQNQEYAQRFLALGAAASSLTITGSLKFDRAATEKTDPKIAELRAWMSLSPGDLVFVAGSTQAPEEQLAYAAWDQLRHTYPQLRLLVVPRHQERFAEVRTLLQAQDSPVLVRSLSRERVPQSPAQPNFANNSRVPLVALLDSLGELSAAWALADVAFVGGSLTNRGGQNMLEPAGYGAAVLFGPNTQNFREITTALLSIGGAQVVSGGTDLAKTVGELLANPALRNSMGAAARQFIVSQQGSTRRTLDVMEQVVPSITGNHKLSNRPPDANAT